MPEQVHENIYMLYIPLPGNPLKWLNSYVIKGADGGRNLLIDTGFNRPECHEALIAGLRELNIEPENTDVFLTHVHSDHTGNAAALQKTGSRIIMNSLDYRDIKTLNWPKRGERYISEGMPAEVCATVLKNNPAIIYAPDSFDAVTVEDGYVLNYGGYSLRCVQTPGHCLGHMCLYSERDKLLFSGDHVLFDITPNICTMGPDTNMLGEYLENLKKIKRLDIETTLPGHRTVGHETVYSRIDALFVHHETRLRETEKIVTAKDGQNAYDIAGQMSWAIRTKSWDEFPPGQKWFAMGEALAHLEYLRAEGRIERVGNPTDGFVYCKR